MLTLSRQLNRATTRPNERIIRFATIAGVLVVAYGAVIWAWPKIEARWFAPYGAFQVVSTVASSSPGMGIFQLVSDKKNRNCQFLYMHFYRINSDGSTSLAPTSYYGQRPRSLPRGTGRSLPIEITLDDATTFYGELVARCYPWPFDSWLTRVPILDDKGQPFNNWLLGSAP